MKELNELVEQAKFVGYWHGSDWSSALCQDKDGKQSHEIICESRGESVISTGRNSNEASWLCDYLELCSPASILAIAEAFRALEKRAEAAEAAVKVANEHAEKFEREMYLMMDKVEAAEANVKELEQEQVEHDGQIANLQGKFDLALAGLRSKTSRCDKAEEKLAELQKQKPIGRVDRGHVSDSNEYPDARVVCLHEHVGWEAFQDGTELFLRPAPAINLAELVPDAMPNGGTGSPIDTITHWCDRYNSCRAAILRNIEEQSK